MNYYAFIAFLLLGFMFIYAGIDWLGFILLALALVTLIYNPAKETADKAWKELDKAQGSVPEEKFSEYTVLAAKKVGEFATKTPHTMYNKNAVVHKTPQMSKNFFSELKGLFK